MKYSFVKMHSVGNDYVFIDCMNTGIDNPGEMAKYVSRRRESVGSDGLILILPSEKADCKMRIFNTDGSEGKMCGNGVRCVGAYMHEKLGKDVSVETASGICRINTEGNIVTTSMQSPSFDAYSVGLNRDYIYRCPYIKEKGFVGENEEHIAEKIIIVNGIRFLVTCVSVGNPHCVIFLKNLPDEIETVSRLLSDRKVFSDGINIEYVYVIDDHTMGARVYERGSGETSGCGSGACAIACAAVKTGRFMKNRWNSIIYPGGKLEVWVDDDWKIKLRGEVSVAFEGVLEY